MSGYGGTDVLPYTHTSYPGRPALDREWHNAYKYIVIETYP